MKRIIIGILTLVLIISPLVGLVGCAEDVLFPPFPPSIQPEPEPTSAVPASESSISIPLAPDIPEGVLSIWKSEPVSETYSPDVSGKVSLKPNKAEWDSDEVFSIIATAGSSKDSSSFYLEEGQWVDVVVSSSDLFIYYLSEEAGAISLGSGYWAEYEGKQVRSTYGDMGIFTPFYHKVLYENIDKGLLFTSSVRLFAWSGIGDYFLTFTNFSSEEACEITYRIYKGGITPGWGEYYKETELQPWLLKLGNMWLSGEITKEEYDEAESQWLEQFETSPIVRASSKPEPELPSEQDVEPIMQEPVIEEEPYQEPAIEEEPYQEPVIEEKPIVEEEPVVEEEQLCLCPYCSDNVTYTHRELIQHIIDNHPEKIEPIDIDWE